MKTISTYVRFLSVIALFISLLSCRNDLNNNTTDFLILVDSIKAPDTVRYLASFDIDFFGTVGFNTSNKFISFNVIKKDNDISIETWGTSDYKPGQCSDTLITLDGQKLHLTLPSPGVYKITVIEPLDFTLVKQITVY
jgi:hypothetical protein